MKDALISVIIPVYNIMDCLERCVRSVCAQTYKQLEILLVDDGSTDGTGRLCDELAKGDGRIRVFHKENGGSSSARNLGIREARGAYLGFVDSDDFIEPQMYERMYGQMKKGGCQIVQISRDELNEDGSRRPDVCIPPKQRVVQDGETFLRSLLLHEGDCSFCTKLIPAALLHGKGFPEGELNEDFRLLVQLLEETEHICILPEQMYHVYYRVGSNTRKKDRNDFSRVFEDIVRNADYVGEVVGRRFPALEKEAVRFGLYQRLDYLLHIPVGRMVDSDGFYVNVKRWCRRHVADAAANPYLTAKQKRDLLLLTLAPKSIRRVHGVLMRLRKAG